MDYLDREGLVAKYGPIGMDVDNIEDVDYVVSGESFATAIGKTSHYDFVLSSHVIEHVPDLIGYLQDCETVLAPGGRMVLIVPDHRCFFDAFMPLSTTGQIIDVHLSGRKHHTKGEILDFFLYFSRMSGCGSWSPTDCSDISLSDTCEQAQDWYDQAAKSDDYIDIHHWYFTFSRFRLIMHELGWTRLREVGAIETGSVEFYAAFAIDGSGIDVSREELHRRSLAEDAIGRLQMLAANDEAARTAWSLMRLTRAASGRSTG